VSTHRWRPAQSAVPEPARAHTSSVVTTNTCCAPQVFGNMPAARYRLQRIVTAREADLSDRQPPASVAGLEAYGEDTAAQLLYLQAMARPAAKQAFMRAPCELPRTRLSAITMLGINTSVEVHCGQPDDVLRAVTSDSKNVAEACLVLNSTLSSPHA